jgi:hypothetical protein
LFRPPRRRQQPARDCSEANRSSIAGLRAARLDLRRERREHRDSLPEDHGRSIQRVRLPVDSQVPAGPRDREDGQDLAQDRALAPAPDLLERGRDLVEQRRRRKRDARSAHHRAVADAGNSSIPRPKKAR